MRKIILLLVLLSWVLPAGASNPTVTRYPNSDVLTTGWITIPSGGTYYSKVDDQSDNTDYVTYSGDQGGPAVPPVLKFLINGPGSVKDLVSTSAVFSIVHQETSSCPSVNTYINVYDNDTGDVVGNLVLATRSTPTIDSFSGVVTGSVKTYRFEIRTAIGCHTSSNAWTVNGYVYSLWVDYTSPIYRYYMVN